MAASDVAARGETGAPAADDAEQAKGEAEAHTDAGAEGISQSDGAHDARGAGDVVVRQATGGAAVSPHLGRSSGPGACMPGIGLSVELATLLGRNDHPATFPGWVRCWRTPPAGSSPGQHRATWLFTVVDDHGVFVWGGLTRRRPVSSRAQPRPPQASGGIVDLIIPQSLLAELAADPQAAGAWARVIDDIAAQHADRTHRQQQLDAHPDRRLPKAALRRHIWLRHRTCRGPGCRQPASNTEYDHTVDYHHHGPTNTTNGGPLRNHDHDLKSTGAWKLERTEHDEFLWTTPLGQQHRTRGEPILYTLTEPGPEQEDPPF